MGQGEFSSAVDPPTIQWTRGSVESGPPATKMSLESAFIAPIAVFKLGPIVRPAPPAPPLAHAPALDGLRGVAVLCVLVHHLDWPHLTGGFLGVDVFFALSGFLITSLLLAGHARRGEVPLGEFFARRALRLYPALCGLVIVSIVSAWWRPEVGAGRISSVATSVLLFFSNWVLIADSRAWMGGMGPTWSLAVEVSFYVGWGLLVWWLTRRREARLGLLVRIAAAIALGSAAWRIWIWQHAPDATRPYCGTDTRLDALFLGVLAALARIRHAQGEPIALAQLGPRAVAAVEALVVAVFAVLVITLTNHSPGTYLFGFAAAGAGSALVIVLVLLNPHSHLARPLQAPWLRWFGRISYSLYLWHLPIAKIATPERLAHHHVPAALVEPLRFALAVVVGALSYYGIERHFLHRGPRRPASGGALPLEPVLTPLPKS